MAPLLLGLGAAGLPEELTLLLQVLVQQDAEETVLLPRQLERLGSAAGPERAVIGHHIMEVIAQAG
ncbi:hypothetical protein [Streptomyces sp. NPDC056387]|uniref:hypothetical protein n=1 Tax=Streptomyces sp. NPDC056387 TaxID=3345803 RepID=UPI0035DD6627